MEYQQYLAACRRSHRNDPLLRALKAKKMPRYDQVKPIDPYTQLNDATLERKITEMEKLVKHLKKLRKRRLDSCIMKRLHADPAFQERHRQRASIRMKRLNAVPEIRGLTVGQKRVYHKLLRGGIDWRQALRTARA